MGYLAAAVLVAFALFALPLHTLVLVTATPTTNCLQNATVFAFDSTAFNETQQLVLASVQGIAARHLQGSWCNASGSAALFSIVNPSAALWLNTLAPYFAEIVSINATNSTSPFLELRNAESASFTLASPTTPEPAASVDLALRILIAPFRSLPHGYVLLDNYTVVDNRINLAITLAAATGSVILTPDVLWLADVFSWPRTLSTADYADMDAVLAHFASALSTTCLSWQLTACAPGNEPLL